MKISLLFSFIFIIFLSLMSCGDDSKSTDTIETEGNWKAKSLTGNINVTYVLEGDTTLSITEFHGLNLNYNMSMTDANYMVEGDYEINSNTTVQGVTDMYVDSYNNIISDGGYSISDGIMFIDEQLFEIEFNGTPLRLINDPNMANYSISNGIMTISETGQMEVMETTGLLSTTYLRFSSTWEKQ